MQLNNRVFYVLNLSRVEYKSRFLRFDGDVLI